MREIALAICVHGKSYGLKRFTNFAAACSNAAAPAQISQPGLVMGCIVWRGIRGPKIAEAALSSPRRQSTTCRRISARR
jgi:hypothetical protein